MTDATDDRVRSGREYPAVPVAGVAAVVLCEDQVLLIRRGREPLLGAWSLPGGALELGETSAEGVVREVFEETSIRAQPISVITSIDRIHRDNEGRVQFHYVLVEWLCRSEEKVEPCCGDDASEARWVKQSDLDLPEYDLGSVTLGIIEQALRIAGTREP